MSDVRFTIGSEWTTEDRHLVYRESEHSFDVIGWRERGVCSLLVNDINLEIDADGQVLFPWGLCPRTTWLRTTVQPPASARRRLVVRSGAPEIAGASRRLTVGKRWPVHSTMDGAWVCVGTAAPSEGQEVIEFSPGAVAVLARGGQLAALWMRLSPV
jgi:hypothetical protein